MKKLTTVLASLAIIAVAAPSFATDTGHDAAKKDAKETHVEKDAKKEEHKH